MIGINRDTYSLALYRTYLQLAFKINNAHVESRAPNQEREDKVSLFYYRPSDFNVTSTN
jgi:hypothetical protein